MTKSTAMIVSGPWRTQQGYRTEVDWVQIQSVDFFKPCKPPQVKGGKTKVKHEPRNVPG
jgi:hypothetical protein